MYAAEMQHVGLACVCLLTAGLAFVACDEESSPGDPGGTAGAGQGAAGPGGSGSGGSGGTSSNGGSGQGGDATGGSGTASGGNGGAGGLAMGCYDLRSCDPLVPDNCGAGSACDIGGGGLQCYAPPNPQMLGQACDGDNGPTCQHGLTCVDGTCREFCCTQSDCSSGTCEMHPESATITIPVFVCLP